jgi:hypothetical protein
MENPMRFYELLYQIADWPLEGRIDSPERRKAIKRRASIGALAASIVGGLAVIHFSNSILVLIVVSLSCAAVGDYIVRCAGTFLWSARKQ